MVASVVRRRVLTRLPALDEPGWKRLVADAEVLSRSRRGDKVFRRPDDSVVKLFRTRRLLSSSLLSSYADRFVRAVPELERRGIPTIGLLGAWRVPSIGWEVVHYRYLEGKTLRAALTAADEAERVRLAEAWVAFLVELHRLGVHFNDTHLDNFVELPDQRMGLIDVGVCRFRRSSLPPRLRAVDFRRIFRYGEDREVLIAHGRRRILERYLELARLEGPHQQRFRRRLRADCPWFFETARPAGASAQQPT